MRTAITQQLIDALSAALHALNTARRFKVGDTDSYAIAAQAGRALKAAENPTVRTDDSDRTATRWAVETLFINTWENCWTVDDGEPLTFATYAEAAQAMLDHITDCNSAVEDGYMEDSPDPSELRVVAIGGGAVAA